MAHKKAAGSAKNLRDSNPKYRGIKLFGGQHVRAGGIIARQKGDKFIAGVNAYKGKDFTIHAGIDGVVAFRKKQILRYDGRKYLKTVIDIVAVGDQSSPDMPKPVVKKTVKKETPVVSKTTTSVTSNDLTQIKGLGPKAAEALSAAGITTFGEMVEAGVDRVSAILQSAGGRLATTDPTPWIEEATSLR